MATLDDDRGEKSLFYVAHSDGRPAGYAKNNRTGEEQRWKASAVTMTKEQFTTIAAPDKLAEREADRAATWEKTAERLRAQLETYPDLSPDHDYLKAKRISLQAGAFETARGSMAIPAFDADGKLWSVQYVNSDGSKRFARDSRKEGCFHIVGAPYSQNLLSTGADGVARPGPIADLRQAKALVIAEGYATAATLKELYNTPSDGEREQLKGDQTEIYRGVQFIAAFDAGNLPHVASALRERYPDKVVSVDRHAGYLSGNRPVIKR
jgi:putative DNA primase/helicase